MSWYNKYRSVLDKPVNCVSEELISHISNNLSRFRSENPIATVAIIAHNEERKLLACLWSLSDNICNYPVEIIGVNNNSTDSTEDVFKKTGVKYFFEEKKSPGYARKCALENTKGKYHICIDADTLYPPNYIQTYIDELQKPNVIAVSALWGFIADKNTPKIGMYIYQTIRNIHVKLLSYKSPELSVRGMTFAFETEYGRRIGYRVDLKRGEDGSMALELKKFGKIKILTQKKVKVATSTTTLNAKGSLLQNFKIEIKKALKGFRHYLIKQDHYNDQQSNLITQQTD